ncbi:GNAT superfamily N-acetyltransferase [Microbacteriaceae bacterium SG_E_30_P1]|uniref:GNAT superfamily N-acetyltransferase n=1 Tax=Antiquaquibacter oligotrophicus TaxID=2880260 RepID=A0ABT6KMQ3_9MICO|nr:GNAT family N-acetyltransferase [Antiquaquibacter oligotrophicus]MDH6181290.1 GNAT superfamily N-acetyltransferase [Antiquaquibacter oligotrophicus]UDF13017.1 GNAT family N-acetyltransferase [Antiquaquibacter oligotrophicus]
MMRRARLASAADLPVAAHLLDAFNREFDTPTPGPATIESRLRELIEQPTTFVILGGDPACSVAVVTLRTNLWSHGFVALLDELYTVPTERGLGWGGAVLSLAVLEAGRRGAHEFEIEVDEPDVDALRFYDRHGFPSRDPQTGERALVIRRTL